MNNKPFLKNSLKLKDFNLGLILILISLMGLGILSFVYSQQTKKVLVKDIEEETSSSPKVYFPLRGVVEGFYGPPWSHQARLRMLDFLAEYNFNIYIYAPKDDPYHREIWREPYPQEKMREFSELIEKASNLKIDFCFALSPGLSIKYSSEEDFQFLINKYRPFQKLGVKCFALFLDDIPQGLSSEDLGKFSSFADAQIYLVKKFYQYLKKTNAQSQLIFCPTEYWGVKTSPYLEKIGEELPEDILIFWTGPQVCSPHIKLSQAEKVAKIIKRKPLIWDNYPVNDYKTNRLFLGPVNQRDKYLYQSVSGFLSNPMNQAEASKIPLITIADYLQNPQDYNPKKSWKEAILKLSNKKAYPYLLTLAENMQSSFLWGEESPTLRMKINKFWEEYALSACGNAQAGKIKDVSLIFKPLEEEFSKFKDLKKNLEMNLDNKFLLAEIEPYIQKFEFYGEAGEKALAYLKSKRMKNEGKYSKKLREDLQNLLKQKDKFPKEICGNIMDLFFIRVLQN